MVSLLRPDKGLHVNMDKLQQFVEEKARGWDFVEVSLADASVAQQAAKVNAQCDAVWNGVQRQWPQLEAHKSFFGTWSKGEGMVYFESSLRKLVNDLVLQQFLNINPRLDPSAENALRAELARKLQS